MDLKEKVAGAMGGLEQLVAGIPGYKGYKEKELRREADKLLRDTLARRFEEQLRRLPALQRELISSGQLLLVDDLDMAAKKLQIFIDRVKTATYGYAGFFDAVKVKEEQLDALYQFDAALLEQVDQIKAGIDKLAQAISTREGVAEVINELIAAADSLNETFHRRQDVILQT